MTQANSDVLDLLDIIFFAPDPSQNGSDISLPFILFVNTPPKSWIPNFSTHQAYLLKFERINEVMQLVSLITTVSSAQ